MTRFILAMTMTSALLWGCATGRVTTTARTAVEEALLSQSAEQALDQLAVRNLQGRSFKIVTDDFEATDGKYILSYLSRRLLDLGLHPAPASQEADVLVHIGVANAAIDDSSWAIGIPELPLILPGVGGLTLPEVILLGRKIQWGRNRVNIYGTFARSGEKAFESALLHGEKHYTRWRVLFVLSFHFTDLAEPFK
jgi:hypothetical protein